VLTPTNVLLGKPQIQAESGLFSIFISANNLRLFKDPNPELLSQSKFVCEPNFGYQLSNAAPVLGFLLGSTFVFVQASYPPKLAIFLAK
jgi:hypothetical protein